MGCPGQMGQSLESHLIKRLSETLQTKKANSRAIVKTNCFQNMDNLYSRRKGEKLKTSSSNILHHMFDDELPGARRCRYEKFKILNCVRSN